MKILIIGNGYIGSRCKEVWGDEAVLADSIVASKKDVLSLIEQHTPDAILNAAGVRGRPNVDWCETHQLETVKGNTELPIIIADACQEKGVYLLHIGSGCIFYGDSPHPDKAWRENDFGNPSAVYSKAKYAADLALSNLPNVGIGRIRMPLDSRSTPGNIIDKLVAYDNIIDVRNSLTVIDDMIDVFHQLMEKKGEGIFHVTNPGTISHREIIDLYEKYVGPAGEKTWVNENDQVSVGLVAKKRSTNILVNERLAEIGIDMPEAGAAAEEAMKRYAASL